VSANVALLKTLLTREGYTVVTASDGQQALNTGIPRNRLF